MIGPESSPRPRGRPRAAAAIAHERVLDAVQSLLGERPFRELTMDSVAQRASVGKPTLYRWWPTKNALVMTLISERVPWGGEISDDASAQAKLKGRVERTIELYSGVFGKIMAGLIGEAQADPELGRVLYETQIRPRRTATIAEIEQGKAEGEFRGSLDAELLVDAIFGAIYYRLLLSSAPLTPDYGAELVEQVLRGALPGDD